MIEDSSGLTVNRSEILLLNSSSVTHSESEAKTLYQDAGNLVCVSVAGNIPLVVRESHDCGFETSA